MDRILIYEDNPELRESLVLLIESSGEFMVMASFGNCSNCRKHLQIYKPDLILMDIDMPDVDGLTGLKTIREENGKVKIIMLTVFDDNQKIFEALKGGANGYLLKKTPPHKLLEYLQEATTGGAPMSASVANQVLKMFTKLNSPSSNDYKLSEREKEVLQWLVNGYSYKMIAAEMFISIDTVRSHIKKIYEKLHVNSKSEAVAKAFKDNLI